MRSPEIRTVATWSTGIGWRVAQPSRTRLWRGSHSVRCSPQVLGASLGVIRQAGVVLMREAGAVTDNPVLLPEEEEVVTGGHFHGQPLAFQLDFIYQAVSEVANIAERRVNLLLSGNGGRLPRFLAADPGLESGLMIAQYLAAGLVSENKSKAFPAAVDSVPTSDGQEDHVSMGSVGALKLKGVLERTRTVVALELLTAGQALQFIVRDDLASRRGNVPLSLSAPLELVLAEVSKRVDLTPGDRSLTAELDQLTSWLAREDLPAPGPGMPETPVVGPWSTRSRVMALVFEC